MGPTQWAKIEQLASHTDAARLSQLGRFRVWLLWKTSFSVLPPWSPRGIPPEPSEVPELQLRTFEYNLGRSTFRIFIGRSRKEYRRPLGPVTRWGACASLGCPEYPWGTLQDPSGPTRTPQSHQTYETDQALPKPIRPYQTLPDTSRRHQNRHYQSLPHPPTPSCAIIVPLQQTFQPGTLQPGNDKK